MISLEQFEFALSKLERCSAVVVECCEGGSGSKTKLLTLSSRSELRESPEEESHHGDMVSAGGQVEGCVSQPVSLVRVGSVPEKHLDNIRIALNNMNIGLYVFPF